jgi:nitrite reductase (NO-forming)
MEGTSSPRTEHLRFILLGLLAIVILVGAAAIIPQIPNSASKAGSAAVPASGVVEAVPHLRGHIQPAVASEGVTSPEALPPLRGVEQAVMTYAPQVPPPISRDYAMRVEVVLEAVEVVKELADGVLYDFWTFGGETPGPMLRVREGDFVAFKLTSHEGNALPHNIDLHSVTGPGGGAEATTVVPGHDASFGFRALRPGLYVYHCAMPPIGIHVANGMYGLILVEPKDGLPLVDREYYVMQSEFYTAGAFGEKGLQPFDGDKALREEPDYVVFNGSVGALKGDGALQAAVGERIRLYVGNGGPNLSSSFHVVGEIMDLVYSEGGSIPNQQNVQTTVVPPGGAAIVELGVDVPGHFMLVDHAIFRAANKGAAGILNVVGPENPSIFIAPLEPSAAAADVAPVAVPQAVY